MASFEHNNSILLLPLLFITVVLTVLSLSLSTATERDTITPTQPLSDNETLVSAGGTFALGFFTPSNSDSRRYVGIWYNHNNITVRKIVWVANRANPVIRSTGQLSITANGMLTITNLETSAVVWSVDNISFLYNPFFQYNPVVQLLDTGNLVVKEEEGTGDNSTPQEYYAWQSFDYPTDTLLPGMKLHLDYGNLTAWKSEDDPSPGEYHAAMVIEPIPEMYLFDGSASKKVWRSGPWDGRQLGGIPNTITKNYPGGDVTYSFVNNYAICDGTKSPVCGCMQGFTPKNPANWGVRDYADGCVRSGELDCREGTDTFLPVYGVKLPESSTSLGNAVVTLDACRSNCLKNCSCTAYALMSGGDGVCVCFG